MNEYKKIAISRLLDLILPFFRINIMNSFNFKGRASKCAYLSFIFENIIIISILNEICAYYNQYTPLHIYLILLIIPGISLQIRRLHDQNQSGWWLAGLPASLIITKYLFLWYPIDKVCGVLYIIPFFGILGFILFWSFLSSENINNRYGYSGLRTELKEMNRIKKAFRLSRMLS
ncbi:MAG: DUF805 domain-containing protein [Pseudomonadota bacterium]|nr:DUF805 domain-containing protein [Pseudomonadota bacterium]